MSGSEVAVVENAVVTEWVDSNGKALEEGSYIRVSNAVADTQFDYSNYTVTPGRDLDFGTVESVNEDGTVSVFWDAAGCSCESGEPRNENPADLTLANAEDYGLFNVAYGKGYSNGEKDAQEELRRALGIEDNAEELKALQSRLEALESRNN